MIRLAHYPQNEHIVRLAEKMGFLLWEEIPIWQGIDFANDPTREKAGRMIREMVTRDKNRCALTFWGVANETQPSGPRNAFLRHLIACCREIDDTRLIVAAFDLVRFDRQRQLFVMDDPFIGELDVVAINKYMGWYHPWPLTPDKAVWDVARGKPLIISEFGGEALYGQHGPADVASSWSEEYQEALYTATTCACSRTSPTCGACRRGFCSTSARRSASTPPTRRAGTARGWFPIRDTARKRGI